MDPLRKEIRRVQHRFLEVLGVLCVALVQTQVLAQLLLSGSPWFYGAEMTSTPWYPKLRFVVSKGRQPIVSCTSLVRQVTTSPRLVRIPARLVIDYTPLL